MPRKPREFEVSKIYHIVKRGVEGRDIFLKPQDYSRFIFGLEFCNTSDSTDLWELIGGSDPPMRERLRKIREEKRERKQNPLVDFLGFALMPNHFHLIVREIILGGTSKFMQKLGGYTTYFNKQYNRLGSLFQSRFNMVRVENDTQLYTMFVYVHTNPVELWEPGWKDFSVKNPVEAIQKLEKYRPSSYNDYIGRPEFPYVVNREFFLNFFGGENKCKQAVEDWVQFKARKTRLGSEVIE